MQQMLGLQLSSQLLPGSSRTYHCLSCLPGAHSLLSWALCLKPAPHTTKAHPTMHIYHSDAFKKIFPEKFMP